MATRTCLLALLVAFTYAFVASESAKAPITGGWQPIKNLTDQHVIDIGKYAIAEFDRQNPKEKLKFRRVVKGEEQVVAGMNYRLVIEANDGTEESPKTFEAVVYERSWEHVLKLTSFKPLFL